MATENPKNSQKKEKKKKNKLGILLQDYYARVAFYNTLKAKCTAYGLEYKSIHWSVTQSEVFKPNLHVMKSVVYEAYRETFDSISNPT